MNPFFLDQCHFSQNRYPKQAHKISLPHQNCEGGFLLYSDRLITLFGEDIAGSSNSHGNFSDSGLVLKVVSLP